MGEIPWYLFSRVYWDFEVFVNEPPRIKDYFACKLCQSVFDLKCFNQTTYVVIVYMRKYDKIYLFALSFKLIKKGSVVVY